MAKTDTSTKKSVKNTHNGNEKTVAKTDQKSSQAKNDTSSGSGSEKKQRKEQAKQEAKLMLKLEQAKKDVQKAEQKLAKAQKGHEDALNLQYTFEEKLRKLRSSEPTNSSNGSTTTVNETAILTLDTPFIVQSVDIVDIHSADTTTAGTDALTTDDTIAASIEPDQPPAEGRTDVPDDTQTQNAQATSDEATSESNPAPQAPEMIDVQIESDGVSMPLLTHNENAWPPPVIREEVAEAAQEEASYDTHEENTPSSDASMSEQEPVTENTATNEQEPTTENTATKSATHRRSRRTNSTS